MSSRSKNNPSVNSEGYTPLLSDASNFGTWPANKPSAGGKKESTEMRRVVPQTTMVDIDEDIVLDEKLFQTPHDRLKMTYISLVLLGAGLLFPWNTVLDSVDYWNSKFPGKDLLFSLSSAYQSANLFGLLLAVLYGSRFSFRVRLIPGFILYLVLMVILPITGSANVAITVSALLGFVDSILQSSLFSLASQFSPVYVAALMGGQGFAGVGVAVLRIITKLSMAQDDEGIKTSTYIFFGLSCLVIVLSLASYMLVLERSPVAQYYLNRPNRERDRRFERAMLEATPDMYSTLPVKHDQYSSGGYYVPQEGEHVEVSNIAIMKRIWPLSLAVFTIFFVTLSVFPGITSTMKSTRDEHLNKTKWYPVIMNTIFLFGDLIGRIVPSWPSMIWMGRPGTYVGSFLRIVYIPLFLACVHHWHLGKIDFGDDVWQYVVMATFALTNGYISTLIMMFAPERVQMHEREQAGTIMVFCLTIGLTSGSWFAHLLNDW